MKVFANRAAAFSLVEVTLALGIAAFCLIAIFGLMPVGVQTNRNATSQTAATNIIAAVLADLRALPSASTTSSQFAITFGTAKTLYFDSQGQASCDVAGLLKPDCSSPWNSPLQTRYRVNISFPQTGGLAYADVKITWPAAASPANASGSAEMFAAFDRN
jgi:Verrucomicrobium spinosum paralogous family TIGR02598